MAVIKIEAKKDTRCTQTICLIQGDRRTQILRFGVNRYDGGVDLSDLVWAIKTTNAKGVDDVFEPAAVEISESKITIDWLVDGTVTDASGMAKYELNGLDATVEGKAVVWKGGTGTMSLRANIGENFGEIDMTNIDRLVLYVEGRLQDIIDLADSLQNGADSANAAAAAANTAAGNANAAASAANSAASAASTAAGNANAATASANTATAAANAATETANTAAANVKGDIDRLSEESADVKNGLLINGIFVVSKSDVERGTFTAANGLADNSKRIRMKAPVFCVAGTKISVDIGELYVNIFELSSSDTINGGNAVHETTYVQVAEYTMQSDGWLYLVFANGRNSAESTSITVDDFAGHNVCAVITDTILQKTEFTEKRLDSIVCEYEDVVVGGINSSGQDTNGDAYKNRCRTGGFIPVADFYYCDTSGDSIYKQFLFCYDAGQKFIGRYPAAFSNMYADRKTVLQAFPNTCYVRIAFSLATNAAMTDENVNDLRSVIFVNPNISAMLQLATMREQEIRARFDRQFNYIAYSSLNADDAPANTEEHYLNCAKANFTSLKGDVTPTLDGKLIMCHDAGYTFDANGKITSYSASNNTPINTLTMAQCKELTFAVQFNGADCHPTDFETYVRICKTYGKCAFVTIRDSSIDDVVAPEVMRILRKYRMTEHAIVNSFTMASLEAIRALDPDIMLSNVLQLQQAPTKANVDTVEKLGNCLLSLFCVPTKYDAALDTVLTGYDEVLNYAYDKNVIVYAAQTSNAHTPILMAHGIMGSQMYRKPNYMD